MLNGGIDETPSTLKRGTEGVEGERLAWRYQRSARIQCLKALRDDIFLVLTLAGLK